LGIKFDPKHTNNLPGLNSKASGKDNIARLKEQLYDWTVRRKGHNANSKETTTTTGEGKEKLF